MVANCAVAICGVIVALNLIAILTILHVMVLKPRSFTLSCRLICQIVTFSGALESHWLSNLLTDHNGAGFTVHFDWLKVWKAGAPVLPKILDSGLIQEYQGDNKRMN